MGHSFTFSAAAIALLHVACMPDALAAPADTVTVTATRINRDGYEAATPTTILAAGELTLRAPDTLANALSRLPQMRNAADEGTGALKFGQSAGRGFVNLRGLGSNRTLVLLDGKRPVSNSLSGDRDVLSLPQALVSRIDVVTGGASTSYGSDAIAGVVNFVLDSRFTGFEISAEGGVSEDSDAETTKFTAAWGNELSDRWRLIASAEAFDRNGLSSQSRRFATPPAIVPNPSFTIANGQRPLLVVRDAYDAYQSPGGLILDGPLAGQQFLRDGSTATYVPASCTLSAPYVLCHSPQDLASTLATIALTAAQRRLAGFARVTFAASPAIEAHFDALLARTETSITSLPLETSVFGLQLPINVAENPFVPEAVRSQYLAAGQSTFNLGRQNTDQGAFEDRFRETVASFSAGASAELGGSWKLSAHLSYGEADTDERWINAYSIDRFLNAVDAVLVDGVPTCRINASMITDPACAPADVFGSGRMSAQSKAYFLGDIHKPLETQQKELSLDLTGEPLSLWAGPVSIAAGLSYREERAQQFNDGVGRGFAFIGYPPFSGEVDVREAYGQAVVPFARGLAFAESIEAEFGARFVDYSQAGSQTPWKLGLNWALSRSLRLRASRSEDIRAPNILELNLPAFMSSISSQVNPTPNGLPQFNALGVAPGQTLNVREMGGGNPTLKPEIARTTAVGLVMRPANPSGLTASLDYYRIRIDDAITTLPARNIVQGCADGDAAQCGLINASPGSPLPLIATIPLNAQAFRTEGLDAELRYEFGVAGGEAAIRALANYILEYEQEASGAAPDSLRGDITSGLPRLQADLSVSFSRGDTTAQVASVYIGAGNYRNNMAAEIQNNHVPHVWYLSAALDYRLRALCSDCSVYASVNNLLDEEPPHPGFSIYNNLDSNYLTGVPYDRIGRYFKVGLRVAW